mmetsp:Transcript_2573/g.4683  ORF Transcript_2573/g.4683 Transcript_2573/m.4683 type:complete len:645 (-) Transcript_2573:90-2024(-)
MADLYRVTNDEILCVDKFIGDESCAELCHRLSENESSGSKDRVKRLVLRGNCLSTRSAQSLGEVLRDNRTLDMLSLEWNQLGSSGASFIAHAMEHNTHLEQVDLRNNGIGDDGALAFGQSLLSNESLRTLDLRWNQIGDDGASSFERVLKQRRTPLSILLTGNLVSHKMMDALGQWALAYKKHQSEPEEESAPTPPVEVVDTYEVRYKELMKEHQQLKHQMSAVNDQNADMRRQLDASAITVTDLEQKFLREEFRNSQAAEHLRLARQKISEMTNEHSVASSSWDAQKVEMSEDHKRIIAEMTTEIKGHVVEKESLKDRLRKAKESLDNLEVHSARLQRQAKEEVDELQEDLRLMTGKASESAIQESKATTEAHMSRAALGRATDRMAVLETEMESVKDQCKAQIEAEKQAYQVEIDQLREHLKENAQESSDKISKLTEDISQLRVQYAEASSAVSTLEIQMHQRCEEAANAAQNEERQRSEAIIENLKLRGESLSNEKRDMERKHTQLAEELKGVRHSHNTELRGLQESLTERREECATLRQEAIELQSKEAKLEADMHKAAAEIDLLRTKVADIDGKEARLEDDLHRVSKERDALLSKVQTQEKEARQEASRKQEDFQELSLRLSSLMTRELDAAKTNFVTD